MTDSLHLTFDELADLHAGVLPDDERTRVRGHLDGCEVCTAELAAFDEVTAILSGVGSESIAMPDDVAAELDQAISTASRERAAGVSSLEAKRAERAHRRRTPWVLIGGAAAAAVVVIGAIGMGGLGGLEGGDDSLDAGSGADVAEDSGEAAAGGSQDSPAVPESGGNALAYRADTQLTRQTLPVFATKLASGQLDNAKVATLSASCAADLPAPTGGDVTYAEVRWQGNPAVVVVDPADKTVAVFGCGTGAEPLYSTSY